MYSSFVAIATAQATSYVLCEMDPGRNSIIYRMTSQKPKTS
jgi:hypothetical protein